MKPPTPSRADGDARTRLIADALDVCRQGERVLAELPGDTAEAGRVRIAVARAREAHQALTASLATTPEALVEWQAIVTAARETIQRVGRQSHF